MSLFVLVSDEKYYPVLAKNAAEARDLIAKLFGVNSDTFEVFNADNEHELDVLMTRAEAEEEI